MKSTLSVAVARGCNSNAYIRGNNLGIPAAAILVPRNTRRPEFSLTLMIAKLAIDCFYPYQTTRKLSIETSTFEAMLEPTLATNQYWIKECLCLWLVMTSMDQEYSLSAVYPDKLLAVNNHQMSRRQFKVDTIIHK